jgi:succinoglycan biosynthesis transport protein ExoP
LISTLNGLKKKLDELRINFTDDYPEVQSVRAHIESLQQEIKSRKGLSSGSGDPQEAWKIETELNAIKETEGNLKRYIDTNQKLINQVPIAKAGLQKLEAEKMNQRNMYDMLFLRKDQSEVSKQMELQDKSTTFRIVDPAVAPVVPVSPNRKKIIMMGIIAGIAGGVGILLLLDFIDQSVTMVSSLKPLGLPVLAVIPLIKTTAEIQVERKKDLQLYFVCGVYFSLILAILVMEMLGLSAIDTMVNNMDLSQFASKVMRRLQ